MSNMYIHGCHLRVLRRKAEGLEMYLFLQAYKEVASPNETVPYDSYLEIRRIIWGQEDDCLHSFSPHLPDHVLNAYNLLGSVEAQLD